ncbi:MAG: hypothetical protein LUE98_08935 [Tannerellaceae bacterium]|nr:hypothetical protein [Tannerellaceae bacterium]
MGFLDRIFKSKAYADKRNPRYACEFRLLGGKYLADEFDISYIEEGGIRRFRLYVVLGEVPDSQLEGWITKGTNFESGEVRFYHNNEVVNEGASYNIRFTDAVCLRYKKSIRGGVPLTTLVLEPTYVNLNGEEFKTGYR